MKQIQLNQVSKRFGDITVIPPLDLEIEEGEFVVFVGPSGCGKSTLLRLIAGLEDVSGGQILINGEDTTMIPPANRGLAMVFQSYALYPHMSVRNNIAFPLRMAGLDKELQNRRVEEAAKVLNLTDFLDRRPRPAIGWPAPARCHWSRNCARAYRVFV
jgi:multiple sugar transport system ATP-binding protein